MIYERHLRAAEQQHRDLESGVPWDTIDRQRALAQPELLRKLRDAAIVESYHPIHIPQVLVQVWDDVDATAILSIEMFEGLRHFHGLKRYLDAVGFEPRLTVDEVVAARRRALEQRAPAPEAVVLLVNFMGSEHFAGYFFTRLAAQADEPVLRGLLERFAHDEFRHAAGIGDVLRQRATRDPSDADRIVEAALAFAHYGGDIVAEVPLAREHDLAAILAFDHRVEQVCGRSPRAQIRSKLAGNGEQRANDRDHRLNANE